MDIANVLLSLGGDDGNTVQKWGVTAAEIAVLRAIHGEASVNEIEPVGSENRSNRAERQRLMAVYGGAKFQDDKPVVETLFPGVAARVFESLDELDLDDSFFKPVARANSRPAEPDFAPSADMAEAKPKRGRKPADKTKADPQGNRSGAASAAKGGANTSPSEADNAADDDKEDNDDTADMNDEHADNSILD